MLAAMPTCWDGVELGDNNNHKDHMAYTVDGTVAGRCPRGFNHRLPQVQLFVRVNNYKGADRRYQLSDGASDFHVDFFNGWQEGKLQEIIDNCPVQRHDFGDYNPPCGCTPEDGEDRFVTEQRASDVVCDSDVRRLIIDEAIDVTNSLPRGTCQGSPLIQKSWNDLNEDLFAGTCDDGNDDAFGDDDAF